MQRCRFFRISGVKWDIRRKAFFLSDNFYLTYRTFEGGGIFQKGGGGDYFIEKMLLNLTKVDHLHAVRGLAVGCIPSQYITRTSNHNRGMPFSSKISFWKSIN